MGNIISEGIDDVTGQKKTFDKASGDTIEGSPILREKCFSDQEIAIDTAGRTIISSTTTFFVSFAGSGPDDEAGLSFNIPDDYDSGGEFAYTWSMDGSSSDQGRIELDITHQSGSETVEHTTTQEQIETLENGYSGTAWRILKSSYYATTLTLAASDYLHIQFIRNPGHINDALSDTMYISAFIFRYKSKQ